MIIGGSIHHQHDCPNCGDKTYGATNPDGGVMGVRLCQECFDRFYVRDDEAEFERRRKRQREKEQSR